MCWLAGSAAGELVAVLAAGEVQQPPCRCYTLAKPSPPPSHTSQATSLDALMFSVPLTVCWLPVVPPAECSACPKAAGVTCITEGTPCCAP